MIFRLINIKYNIAIISLIAMFSCANNTKEVKDLLVKKNKPIGIAKDVNYVYKDSGKVTNKLKTPILNDFSNRKEHPYNEFPKGLEIVIISKNQKDSTTIIGDYALTYNKTNISEIKGNVIIINHTQKVKLETNQLFWDQKEKYIFTEKGFRLTTTKDTINGFGFESKQDLTKWVAKDITGDVDIESEKM
ncbi:MAG: LPS export ABC transporter periplasmic protein LptC [Tenacibaculum sp.]|nr:LPS export ABC transporter periplasmic protein LptC [Tenacibaculum sp.]